MSNLIGQQLGNYRLTQLLGQGGFAEVYLGEHVRLKMQAAIKVLHAHLSQEEAESFQREAQVIADLVHPNIVRVLDFDIQQNKPFLVLDYAPNGSLRQQHPRGTRVPLPQVVSYVKQVGSALQFAHERKLIHRDIKPENMLLGRHGEVLLSDFGIVAIAHSTSSMSTQASMGTVPYMAPEQIQAYPRPASDQYALGIVVYQWLSGELPFQGSATEIIVKHLSVQPVSLLSRVPDVSAEVEQILFTALAKEPKERFGSVQAFANALEQASKHGISQPLRMVGTHEATEIMPSRMETVVSVSKERDEVRTRANTPVVASGEQMTAVTPSISGQQGGMGPKSPVVVPAEMRRGRWRYAFWQGLIFSLPIIIISIIFHLILSKNNNTDYESFMRYIVIQDIVSIVTLVFSCFFVGLRTARRTAAFSMGLVAGLWLIIWSIVLFSAISFIYSLIGNYGYQFYFHPYLLVQYGIELGIVALGSLVGRSRARRALRGKKPFFRYLYK